jgi:Glycosyltransferase
VEQTRTLLAFLRKDGGDTRPLEKLKLIGRGVRRISDNLYVISPPMLLPFRYFPIIYELNQKSRLIWLKHVLKTLEIRNPILITFDPDSGEIIGRLGEKLSVYYRNDHHDRRSLWFNPDSLVRRREETLIRRVNLVFALSRDLATKCESNQNTHVLPNGVNIAQYEQVLNEDEKVPTDIAGIPEPRIGIVGMLDWRTDVHLLEELATRQPTWSIVFVGPIASKDRVLFERLLTLQNVHFLGLKRFDEVPRYIRAMNIGLIPYKINEYTRGILSLKLFEYSAAGIPTVASAMPELQPYSGIIDIATTPDEWEASVRIKLSSHSTANASELIDFARRNSWAERVEEMSRIIQRQAGMK